MNGWPGKVANWKARLRSIVTDQQKGIMSKQKILINHWRWLEANGYKKQAASCKLQAASLTRLNYNVIVSYKRKDKRI